MCDGCATVWEKPECWALARAELSLAFCSSLVSLTALATVVFALPVAYSALFASASSFNNAREFDACRRLAAIWLTFFSDSKHSLLKSWLEIRGHCLVMRGEWTRSICDSCAVYLCRSVGRERVRQRISRVARGGIESAISQAYVLSLWK